MFRGREKVGRDPTAHTREWFTWLNACTPLSLSPRIVSMNEQDEQSSSKKRKKERTWREGRSARTKEQQEDGDVTGLPWLRIRRGRGQARG
jgi:hypothetical protein